MSETELSILNSIKKYALRVYCTMPVITLLFDSTLSLGLSNTTRHYFSIMEDKNISALYITNKLPSGYFYKSERKAITKLPSIKTVLSNDYSKSMFIRPPKPPTSVRATKRPAKY